MSVKVDARGAYRAGARFKSLGDRMDQAERLAAIDLRRALMPEAVRQIQLTHNLNSARVRESLGIRLDGSVVELTGYYRGTGLLQYGAKASKRSGVTVTVLRGGGSTNLRHAFKATGLSGNTQIFERDLSKPKRVMTRGNYIGERRQPIKTDYGPSIAQAIRYPVVHENITRFSMSRLAESVRRHLGRL